METVLNDIRYGCRVLAKNPGFTLVVVLALALSIGANTAIFSAMNAVLFKPLPYPDPDKLVMVWGRFTGIGIPDDRNWISPPELMDLRRYSKSFTGLAAMSGTSFNIRVGETPERIDGAFVSSEFFRLLGIEPNAGRAFLPEDGQQGRDTVLVLGHGLWQRRFASDASVIGRAINVNGRSYTIVGVAPPGFRYPYDAEMWAPLAFTNEQLTLNFRGSHGLEVLGRIKPEVTLDQARAEMDIVTRQIIEGAPEYPYRNFNFLVLLSPLLEEFVGEIRPALAMLMGAVVLVLLIACANVANLLLVRASVREREIAVRTALGATRGRLIRQMLTESVLLAVAGAFAGVLLAWLGLSALTTIGGQVFPRLAQARLDLGTLAFTTAVAFATGILFGIAPALQATGATAHESLKEGGRSATSGVGRQRLRRFLIVSEVALALVLLAGAGLLIKSFMRLQQVDPGFKGDGVLTLRISLPQATYSRPEQVRNFFRELEGRVRRLPGVEALGAITGLPLTGQGGSGTTTVDTQAVPPDQASPEADSRGVTPGYLQAMGVQLIKGRFFEDRDNETVAPVVIIDESMAKTYWPNEDQLGRRIKRGGAQSDSPWMTVIGVVRHVRHRSLERPSRVQYYWSHAQRPASNMSLAIRTSVDPRSLATSVQREVMALDRDQPIYAVRTMSDVMAVSVMRRRLVMLLLAIFAGVALVLAAVGIYGVISYWVTQRTHEIGIRVALGATQMQVLRMVFGQSLSVVAVGILLGVIGSLALARLLEQMLFNVSASDPPTFALVSSSLIAVALLASYLPARRAARLDPAHTLRQE